jgi:hypothetical protein
MKRLLLVTILIMFMVSPSFGFTWTYYDFGGSYFDYNNNWSPVNFPLIGNVPAPGPYTPGGEEYDLEGLNWAADADYIYLSITNSFGYLASNSAGDFRLGDLFFGTASNPYMFALDLQAGGNVGNLWQINDSTGWNFIQDTANSYGEFPYPYGGSIRDAMGAHEINFGGNVADMGSLASGMMTDLGDIEVGYMTPGNGGTYVWEIRVDNPGNAFNYEPIWVHLNVGCGNDLLVSEIPEPTTMLLFGMGLLGTGSMFRRRKK